MNSTIDTMDHRERSRGGYAGWIPAAVLAISLFTIFLIPLIVTSFGYTPADDLLRDVAKAVSGRDWGSVIVMREGLNPQLSTHPGWDFILRFAHEHGMEKEQLVNFAIIALAFVAFLPGIVFLRRPELLLLMLLVVVVLDFGSYERFFFGRPFLVDVAYLSSCWYLWDAFEQNCTRKRLIVLLIVLTALRVWIRSTLPMLLVPLLVVYTSACFTRRWKPALVFTRCVAVGAVLGALLTGGPLEFVWYNLQHFQRTLFRHEGNPVVVTELQPLSLNVGMLVLLAGYLSVRLLWGRRTKGLAHPAFLMLLAGWGLSFWIARFWYEYGLPALCVWGALDMQADLDRRVHRESLLRLVSTVLCSVTLIMAAVIPHKASWQQNPVARDVGVQRLYAEDPTWFPQEGGLLYSASMQVFFTFYYMFPSTSWRYVTGMEAGFMRQEDLVVYEEIYARKRPESYLPWIQRMRSADRFVLVLPATAPVATGFPMLEWRFVPPRYWFGRLPDAGTSSESATSR